MAAGRASRRLSSCVFREQAGHKVKHELAVAVAVSVAPALLPALVVQVAHSVDAAGLRRWFGPLSLGRFGFVVAA